MPQVTAAPEARAPSQAADRRTARNRPAAFYLILQVWGEAYTRTLLDYALPALLSPGNIPALAASAPTILKLYTTDPDLARIKASPSFSLLETYVTVQYHSLDTTPDRDKYAAMTAIHREVVRDAFDANAALIWLLPDTIWSDGSLRVVAAQAAVGKRMVMQAGVRILKTTALPAIDAIFAGQPAVAVAPRQLVKLALDHMHPYNRAWFWDAPSFNRNPANVYWRVGESGVLIRAFHLHPLMMFPERRVHDFVSTCDDDLPLTACPSREGIYVATDSDEIFHVDLAGDDWREKILMLDRRPSAAYLATWAYGGSNLHHRWMIQSRIRVHGDPLDERWAPVERESDRIIARIRWWLAARHVSAALLGFLAGQSRRRILEGARRKLGWELLPPRKAWFALPETFRRFAFRHTLYVLYGKNVTVRALGLDVQMAKPWARRIDTWWRHSPTRAAARARWSRARSNAKRWKSTIHKGRYRATKQARRALVAARGRFAKRLRRAGRTWSRGRVRGTGSRSAR
jgi:hypothetical protein